MQLLGKQRIKTVSDIKLTPTLAKKCADVLESTRKILVEDSEFARMVLCRKTEGAPLIHHRERLVNSQLNHRL